MTNFRKQPLATVVGSAQRRTYGHVRVLVVDDSALVRRGIVRRLASMPGIKVVGEAETSAEGIRAVTVLRPSVVILDIEMPGGSGLDVLAHVKANMPRVTVMMFSGFRDEQMRARCRQMGADYSFLKPEEFSQLMKTMAQLVQQMGWAESMPSEDDESSIPR